MRTLLLIAVLLGSGCGIITRQPTIKAGEVTVTGPKDAGKPSTLNTSDAGTTMPIPAGSLVKVTQTEAQPATETKPAIPATTTTEITPASDTVIQHTEKKVVADTGTIDTSVRKHQIDSEERRWLLWAAIACGLWGIVVRSMVPAWPSLSNGLLLAAVLAGLSWKLSDVPSWVWMLVLGIVGLLVAGYKRAEWDKDGNGIPDALQKK